MPQTAYLNPAAQAAHNRRNTIHTLLLVAGSAVLMAVTAYGVVGIWGVAIAVLIVLFGVNRIRNMSPAMVLKLYKAQPLPRNEMPEIHDIVEQLSSRAKLPTVPKVYYVPSKMLNAFAVGSPTDSAIAITDGLLRAINTRQLAGIMAHETAHIMNGDLKVMGLADILNRATGILQTIGLFGTLGVFGLGLNISGWAMLLLLIAPTIGGLLQLGLSRAREYDADLDGATLTADPEGLASALLLLEEKQRGMWEGLFLPGGRSPHPSLLRTHPKTEDRVARLQALTGREQSQIFIEADQKPQPSFVPPVRDPRIQWQRLGVYY
jgi:heat shock protein HtpX